MPWQLALERVFPGARVYRGPAERFVAELRGPPEQVTLGLYDTLVARVVEYFPPGGPDELLRIRVYRDTTPTWATLYRVEVIGHGSPIPWALIALALGAIAALALITWNVSRIDWEGVGEVTRDILMVAGLGLVVLVLVLAVQKGRR